MRGTETVQSVANPMANPRSIRLIRERDERGVGVFRIQVGHVSQNYTFREIRCEIGGRGFEVHRLGLGNLYHVRVGKPTDCTCECIGFLSRNSCRHIAGLRALIREGYMKRARYKSR